GLLTAGLAEVPKRPSSSELSSSRVRSGVPAMDLFVVGGDSSGVERTAEIANWYTFDGASVAVVTGCTM
ncbi:MAG: hypothetical protein ABL897_13015, partial [Hyphomicrobium sp.]